jgi:hypothetical protein
VLVLLDQGRNLGLPLLQFARFFSVIRRLTPIHDRSGPKLPKAPQ